MTDVENIISALSTLRLPAQPEEYEIHCEVEHALSAAGILCVHEYSLAPGCRVDFFCEGVGIEVKKSRPSASALRRQIERYMKSDKIAALIVVLQKPCPLPESMCGKPLYVVSLNRLWGIALP